MKVVWFLVAMLSAMAAFAEQVPDAQIELGTDPSGEVRVPLSVYQQMWQLLSEEPGSAPASYAVGTSSIRAEVVDFDDRSSAQIRVTLSIEVFEDEWTLVPVLATGAALQAASVDGQPVQLVQTPQGLAWSTSESGRYEMSLSYDVDAQRSEAGYVLPLPVPVAAATDLQLDFPSTGLDLAVVPAANLRTVEANGRTKITASVPATSAILVSWRVPLVSDYAISRARYVGSLIDDAVVWDGELQVQAFSAKRLTIPLLPSAVTLTDVGIDGAPATVFEQDGKFATVLQGRGSHEVNVRFLTPVIHTGGPPRVDVSIPKVPVSQFELKLPGRKEVSASSGANVQINEIDEFTVATVHVPLSEQISLGWVDAVPAELRTAARANAAVYHAVHAEEGVLQVAGTVVYEITHGEISTLNLELPVRAEVNRIVAPSGGVSDWTEAISEDGDSKTIIVFLDREVRGEFTLNVFYEQLLGPEAEGIDVPLLMGKDLHRQRGMVALLVGSELSLSPSKEVDITRVGENQLPAYVRNALSMRVAHTYKYVSAKPILTVATVAPERAQGKFDAQVDTLISIGEVTLKGAASVEIDVKSGAIMALDLLVPENLNILGVTGPSLRTHEVASGSSNSDGQTIHLAFTQEMTGQFRLEVNYERILTDAESDPVVPTLHVVGAEVEHGRIAVEALTAVEVQALTQDHLSTLEVSDLPQQMILKTTNPILLAFKYVQAIPPAALQLQITRHEQIEVQVAAVEQATYSTLLTRDGLAVTTASLSVRNSRRQFLRLQLPAESDVWSVFVDGKPARPARTNSTTGEEGATVLIRMINSANAFPVEVVYATRLGALGFIGALDLSLPRPDMVVTNSRWDLFLPQGPDYRAPKSNMDVLHAARGVNPEAATKLMMARAADALAAYGQPLRINVPQRGVHLAFEKLYATQAPEDPYVRVGYTSASGNRLGELLGVFGVVLIWASIFALAAAQLSVPRQLAFTGIGIGSLIVLVAVGPLGASATMLALVALILAAAFGIYTSLPTIRAWRDARATG
ncbi:MAG: hypothetical protein ACR2PZ_06400 [Pseudomonadales bacterium]